MIYNFTTSSTFFIDKSLCKSFVGVYQFLLYSIFSILFCNHSSLSIYIFYPHCHMFQYHKPNAHRKTLQRFTRGRSPRSTHLPASSHGAYIRLVFTFALQSFYPVYQESEKYQMFNVSRAGHVKYN